MAPLYRLAQMTNKCLRRKIAGGAPPCSWVTEAALSAVEFPLRWKLLTPCCLPSAHFRCFACQGWAFPAHVDYFRICRDPGGAGRKPPTGMSSGANGLIDCLLAGRDLSPVILNILFPGCPADGVKISS